MRIIIAGSRGLRPTVEMIHHDLRQVGWWPTRIISGTARGVDRAGEEFAAAHGIPVKRMPADWDRYGKVAGRFRNEEMARAGDALLAYWDGSSPGTADMIRRAKEHGLLVHVVSPQPKQSRMGGI